MAPEMQILTFLTKDFSSVLKKSQLAKHPIVGKKCFPMTLSDELRLFVPLNDSINIATDTKICHTLGVPFSSIMDEVKQGRRKREREKLHREATSPTSVVALEKVNSQLWVDKHAPGTVAHLLSNERCNREVIRALREWDPYVFGRASPKRPDFVQTRMDEAENQDVKNINPKDKRPVETSRVILLSGPPGVG
jgi:hypothetical protein